MAEIQVGDRIITAISLAHRQLFFARFHSDWFQSIVASTLAVIPTTLADDVRTQPWHLDLTLPHLCASLMTVAYKHLESGLRKEHSPFDYCGETKRR